MASYNVTIYLNSGFNAVNIPDSPALLNSLPTASILTLSTIDVVQNRFLEQVKVRATYDTIKNADYCAIGDFYYFITAVNMSSNDVAVLNLAPDFLTSNGGVTGLHILDGITERVHTADDEFGKYCESDDYMLPSRPLELQIERITESDRSYQTVVESTVNLESLGNTANPSAVTYTDSGTGETVTVPKTPVNQTQTTYLIGSTTLPVKSRTVLFDASNSTVKDGVNKARDLGISDSISAQVSIPSEYVNFATSSGSYTALTGKVDTKAVSNFPYAYANPKNKRVLYGKNTPIGIITCGGDSAEFSVEDIFVTGETYPTIRLVVDPRTDGRPYFRFKTVNGDDSIEGFFRNCVPGMQWKQVPLVYTSADGNALNRIKYENDRAVSQARFDQEQANMRAGAIADVLSGVGAGASRGAMGGGGIPGAIIGGAIGLATGGLGAYARVKAFNEYEELYKSQVSAELSQFAIAQEVFSPTVNFPYNAEAMRDMLGNTCFVYRYKYSSYDITRIDKILTMYGYRVTKNLEVSDFTNRQYFNYVRTSISVGKLPRWYADGIASQLRYGVRIWHVLPDNQYYSNNPIVSA